MDDDPYEVFRREVIQPDDDDVPADLQPLESMNFPRVNLFTVEGTPMEEWVFPGLEQSGGLIISTDDDTDPRWTVMYGAGMPQDLRRIDVIFLAAILHPKYEDFAIHCKGVVADPMDIDKGSAAWKWRLTKNETGEVFVVHVWTAEIFLRGSSTRCVGHYNAGINPHYQELTGISPGIRFELSGVDPDDVNSAHRLIDSIALLQGAQAAFDAVAKRGRRKGTGHFKDKESFLKALADVLSESPSGISQPQVWLRLTQHKLWQGKTLTLAQCQTRQKSLRNWLEKSGLTWTQAKKELCGRKRGK